MPIPMDAPQVLDREFLELRAKILQIAASIDRIERADGSVAGDPRIEQLRRGIDELQSTERARAERVQMIFSLPYEPSWRKRYGL